LNTKIIELWGKKYNKNVLNRGVEISENINSYKIYSKSKEKWSYMVSFHLSTENFKA